MTSVQWLVDFATYLPHCYLCLSQRTNAYQFVFSKKQPVSTQDCSWKLVANERNEFRGGAKKFDKMLVESIMYSKSEIVSSHKNATRIWQFFEQYFDSVGGLMNYIQVYPVYLTQGLKQLHEDNIQHFEIRSSFKKLYYLSGKRADPRTFIEKFNQGVKQFQEIHCSSCTVRLIISKYRGSSAKKIRHTMSNVAKFQRLYPRLIVGFDLVGHEDAGRTLYHFYPQFKAFNLTFFFHAGETNWQGVSTDENLFDAILLKTKRIGHGLAITKHPVLLEMAKERNIPIEVSPISNQVLGYVSDLRNHPASVLIAKNVSIVVNSDDPATWGSSGLSHDFYALFMGIASMHDDLRLLKKLALDSIRGKVAFITGGGSGICFTIAEIFMRHQCDTAIASRNLSRLENSARRLEESTGRKCLALQVDVRKPEEIKNAVEKTLEKFQRIDILINGAAGNFLCPAVGLSFNAFRTIMDIDTMGTFNTSKIVFEKYMQNHGGVIVNITATQHLSGVPLQCHVGAAKSAIEALSRHLAVEWGPHNVRVMCVAPGPVEETEGYRRLAGNVSKEFLSKMIPIGKIGSRCDIANVTLFIVSEAGNLLTGSCVIADGGSWMGMITAAWNTSSKL